MEHLFVAYGIGFEWEDGELVDLFPESDAEALLRRAKRYAKSYAMFARLGRITGEDGLGDEIIARHRTPVPPLTRLTPHCKYAAILNLPDDITRSWLDAAWRAYYLITSFPDWPCTVFEKIWGRLFYLWRTR